jgi:hypothetical protein
MAGLPVEQLGQRVEMRKSDPSSEVSKFIRDYVKSNFGAQIADDVSAAELEKQFPVLAKVADTKLAMETKREVAEQNAHTRQEAAKEKKKEGDDKTTTKRFDDMGKKIAAELGSSRSAFGKGANIVRSAEAMEQLTEQMNPNDLDNRQIKELARNLDAMLSSGASTISGTNGLVPSSWTGDEAKLEEYIRSIPKGAKQGEFVHRMMETVAREKGLAKQQIKNTQKKILGSYSDLKEKDSEKWDTIMNVHGLPSDIFDTDLSTEAYNKSKKEEKETEDSKAKIMTKEEANTYQEEHGKEGLDQLIKEHGYTIGK